MQVAFPCSPFPLGGLSSASKNISAISNVSGAAVALTVTAHGFTVGSQIFGRIAGVTGQTAINGNWNLAVTDANTLTILYPTGWSASSYLLGNGTASTGGTIFRTPLPITANHPEFANQGITVNGVDFSVGPSNAGNIYVGVIVPPQPNYPNGLFMTGPQAVTPIYKDVMMVLPKTLTTHVPMPMHNPTNANMIDLDILYLDFDTAGDVGLAWIFAR